MLRQVNKFDDSDESSDEESGSANSEHIFLIDRSESMQNKLKYVIKALTLMIKSLPRQSQFNICSFGTEFQFIYSGKRSIENHDRALSFAVA